MAESLPTQKLTWKEARQDVHRVNPDLAAIIDQLDPPDQLHLIKAKYKFGDVILNADQFYLPTEKGVVSIADSSVDQQIKDGLIFNAPIPMGILLNRRIELNLNLGNRLLPFSLMRPGKIFALWDVLHQSGIVSHAGYVWKITAGACSLAMLPKISDIVSFRRLKQHYQLNSAFPKYYDEQWSVFSELAHYAQPNDPWTVELLFFPKSWIDKLDDPAWISLKAYLYQTAWQESRFLRDSFIFAADFSRSILERNLKPNPYLSDTVKHLYAMMAGYYPGFVFAGDDDAAPIGVLQDVFANIYELKYLPSMLQLGYLSDVDPGQGVYYSLQWPTSMQFSPKSRRKTTKLEDLREIKHIMDITLQEIANGHQDEDLPIYSIIESICCGYFHCNKDISGEIEHTSKLLSLESVLQRESKYYQSDFCVTSSLIRGCIRLCLRH